jgi:GAF domain-containing protein
MIAQEVLDTLPFGVLLTDAELQVVQVNLWLADRLAMPTSALIARPLAAAFPELAERSLLAAFDLARHDGRTVRLPASLYTYILKLSAQTGDSQADMPQSATIAPLVVDGRVVGTMTLIEDETQRLLNERQLQRQIDKMTALHEVDRALATLDLDACLQTIAERSRILFGAQNSALLMRRDGQLAVVAATGYEEPVLGKSIGEGQGITGWVVDHHTPLLLPDVSRDQRYFELDGRTRSEMAAPLMLRELCIGVINVESHNLDAFDADDMDTMEWLAARAAAAIHNAQLHAAEREQRTLADTLRNIGLMLSAELNPDAILDTLLDHVARVVPYDSACVLMFDQRTGHVRIARERGYARFGAPAGIAGYEVPLANFANLVQMAEHLQPLVIDRTRDDAAWIVTDMSGHIESWAGAPIIARGQLLGFL